MVLTVGFIHQIVISACGYVLKTQRSSPKISFYNDVPHFTVGGKGWTITGGDEELPSFRLPSGLSSYLRTSVNDLFVFRQVL